MHLGYLFQPDVIELTEATVRLAAKDDPWLLIVDFCETYPKLRQVSSWTLHSFAYSKNKFPDDEILKKIERLVKQTNGKIVQI